MNMSIRKITFEVGKYYHVYNRGVDKRKIFMNKGDLYYFFDSIIISNVVEDKHQSNNSKNARKNRKEKAKKIDKLVSIIAYSLLPNHYHFILKEEVEGGISKFMQKLGTSYTMYFNKKYERTGVLFQGKFKAKEINSYNGLEVLSVYVNMNYKHHKFDIKKDLTKSSIFEYLDKEAGEEICNRKEIKKIIKEVGGTEKYKTYLKDISKYFTERHNENINLDYISFDELEK